MKDHLKRWSFLKGGYIVAKAKKLPSGNWRCEAYLGRDTNGKQIKKSFTAPTRKEAEYLVSQYVLEKKHDKETPTFLSAYNQLNCRPSSVLLFSFFILPGNTRRLPSPYFERR